MNFRFSISGKLLALGGVGLFFVIAVGAAGYATTASLAHATQQILDDGSALKFQMQADQAHDALRADVLASLLQHYGGADAASVRKDLDAHAGEFRSALQQLERLPLDAETRAALEDVRPALDEYLASATSIVGQAEGDKAGAQGRMGAFMVSFGKVEKEMADLSELIARRSHDIHDRSARAARLATWSIVAAMLGCAGVLLATSLLIGRSIVTRVRRAVQIADTVVSGDLGSRIQARGNDEAAQLLQALARMNGSLVELVGTVRPAGENSASGHQHPGPDAARQAGRLQPTTAPMGLCAAVPAATASSRHANLMAVTASDSAARGGEAVQNLVATMTGITEASKRITDIIGVIDDIAFLTNILALNAAVEAGRAGEQGRGVAVLATEVRTLAQRSAAAAKEIKQLIAGSIEQVTAGERQATHARDNLAVVVEQVRQLTRVLAEVTSVRAEQDNGLVEISRPVSPIEPVTHGNGSPMEESAAAADGLDRQATRLVEAVSQFRLGGEQRPPVTRAARAG